MILIFQRAKLIYKMMVLKVEAFADMQKLWSAQNIDRECKRRGSKFQIVQTV